VTYTQLAVLGVVAAVVVDLAVLRVGLLRRRAFWVAYAIVLPFQLLTNGWLTGRRIVVYDPAATLAGGSVTLIGDGRIGFAPVEDLLFGFALVVVTLDWWVFWGRRGVQREPVRGRPWWPTGRGRRARRQRRPPAPAGPSTS
jgi:lycopene cyclase domain-containing protein